MYFGDWAESMFIGNGIDYISRADFTHGGISFRRGETYSRDVLTVAWDTDIINKRRIRSQHSEDNSRSSSNNQFLLGMTLGSLFR